MKNAIIHISFIVSTILFASKASLTQENFTGIANNLGHYQALIGWSIIAACYFYRYSMRLFKSQDWHPNYLKPVSIVIFIGISVSGFIPYNDSYIHLEALHTLCSLGASLLFLGLLLKFMFDMQFSQPLFYQTYHLWLRMIIATLIILLMTFGNVNSLIEVVMVISLCCFFWYIEFNEKE